MLRFLTAGESHGRALMVIVEGLPAGLPLTVQEVQGELARRRLGFGRGPRMRFEQDEVTLVAGVRHGTTLGAPVGILIGNTEWPKWEDEMSPAPGRTERRYYVLPRRPAFPKTIGGTARSTTSRIAKLDWIRATRGRRESSVL